MHTPFTSVHKYIDKSLKYVLFYLYDFFLTFCQSSALLSLAAAQQTIAAMTVTIPWLGKVSLR